MKQLNDNTTQHMLRQRLVRIETKLSHLMAHLGMEVVNNRGLSPLQRDAVEKAGSTIRQRANL